MGEPAQWWEQYPDGRPLDLQRAGLSRNDLVDVWLGTSMPTDEQTNKGVVRKQVHANLKWLATQATEDGVPWVQVLWGADVAVAAGSGVKVARTDREVLAGLADLIAEVAGPLAVLSDLAGRDQFERLLVAPLSSSSRRQLRQHLRDRLASAARASAMSRGADGVREVLQRGVDEVDRLWGADIRRSVAPHVLFFAASFPQGVDQDQLVDLAYAIDPDATLPVDRWADVAEAERLRLWELVGAAVRVNGRSGIWGRWALDEGADILQEAAIKTVRVAVGATFDGLTVVDVGGMLGKQLERVQKDRDRAARRRPVPVEQPETSGGGPGGVDEQEDHVRSAALLSLFAQGAARVERAETWEAACAGVILRGTSPRAVAEAVREPSGWLADRFDDWPPVTTLRVVSTDLMDAGRRIRTLMWDALSGVPGLREALGGPAGEAL